MAADKELIKGINMMLAGKEEGFNVLYSKTYNYVYGRAKMIMKDEEDALDLTQETFIQAYKNIHTLEDVNNIYAWLGGIVYRHGMKIFRKKRDLLVNEDAEGIFEDIVSEDRDFRPEESAEEKATSNVIMSMIQELPELQKAALLAFYYDNMKIDDIAAIFDCSSNTIKSRLNYAKKYLKDKVEAHEKAYAYRLHSVSPAVIILAFKSLFASEQYTMTAAVAQGVYNGACAAVGFAPAAIATAQAAVTTATTGGAISATTTTATTAATTAASSTATTVGAGVAKAGMAIGTKIAIGIATVATAGALGVGGMYIANNLGLFGSQEEEIYREGDIVTSVDEYYELMAEYAEDGVTDFEIYVELNDSMGSQAFLDSGRLLEEYGIKAGIYGEYLYETELDESGGYDSIQKEIDGVTYQVWAGTLEYGDNVYIAGNAEEYKACIVEALSKKQEKFVIYTYYKDMTISAENVEAYHQDGRIDEIMNKVEEDCSPNIGNEVLSALNVDGLMTAGKQMLGAQYPLWIYHVTEFEVDVDTISDLELEEEEAETDVAVKGWTIQDGEYYGHGGNGSYGGSAYIITIKSNYVDPQNTALNTYDITVLDKLDSHKIYMLEAKNVGFTNVDGQDALHFGGMVYGTYDGVADGTEQEWDIYLLKAGENDLIVYHYLTENGRTVKNGVTAPNVLIHKENDVIDRRAEVEEDTFAGTDINGNAVVVDITEFSLDQHDIAQYIPEITFVDPRTNNTVTIECTSLLGYHGQYAHDIRGICSFYCYSDSESRDDAKGWGYFYYDQNGNICLTYSNENGDLVLSDVTCYKN